jgi:hypothetical protein
MLLTNDLPRKNERNVRLMSESQDPIDLYNMLYDLNEQHGYGHEVYNDASIKHHKMMQAKKK